MFTILCLQTLKMIIVSREVARPIISYDKFIDDMGLNENYHLCIFMNINKMSKVEEKRGEMYIAIACYFMRYKIYLASLKPTFTAASVVTGASGMP